MVGEMTRPARLPAESFCRPEVSGVAAMFDEQPRIGTLVIDPGAEPPGGKGQRYLVRDYDKK